MSRIPRPHIPVEIRLQVVARQLGMSAEGLALFASAWPNKTKMLTVLLRILRAKLGLDREARLELHHRPALTNRQKLYDRGKHVAYSPPANDPDYLYYLPDDDHDIETRVRGVGAQRSDLSQRRYLKRVAANRKKRAVRSRRGRPGAERQRGAGLGWVPQGWASKRSNRKRTRRRWPSRPLRSANRWPKRRKRKERPHV